MKPEDLMPENLMTGWLLRQLPPADAAWLCTQRDRLRAGASERDFNLAFSLAPRRLGKADLALGPEDLAAAHQARPGWDPRGWSVDQVGRLVLLLAQGGDGPAFNARLHSLLATADLAESITLLRGLPLYPDPALHLAQAREGARTAMRPVFEAVAHANPYPAEVFDEAGWNQLVLKALFIETTLAPIQGLDRRANPILMRMLCDYAHERWAAGRPVSPELWRCVGPWADDAARDDLAQVLRTGEGAERQAARAALSAAPPLKKFG
jgi:hypothetical protein